MVAKFEEAPWIGIRLLDHTKRGQTLIPPSHLVPPASRVRARTGGKKKRVSRSVRKQAPFPTTFAPVPPPLEPTAMPTQWPRPSEEHYDTVDLESMGREWLARATDAVSPQENARTELERLDPSLLTDHPEDAAWSRDSQWEAAFQYTPRA